jgi:peroxiredoxin
LRVNPLRDDTRCPIGYCFFTAATRERHAIMIKSGDTLPSMKLMTATADGPREVSTDDLFRGKRVALFAVPGAFTPTCSARHLPGFVEHAAEFTAKGIDSLVCLAVNDAFVMGAWAKSQNVGPEIVMLADGSAQRRSGWNSTWLHAGSACAANVSRWSLTT